MPFCGRQNSERSEIMNLKYTSPRVFFPKSINEALEMNRSEGDAVFWAGGTYLSRYSGNTTVINLPKNVISLGMIEELARATRSENSLEFGSMMSLDRLAAIGRNTLPTGLHDSIIRIGSRPMRCRATIGGHLAVKDKIGDLRPLLQLLETTVETRSLKERHSRRKALSFTRKFPIALLEENPGLKNGELICRISIPTDSWDFGTFKKIIPTEDKERFFIFTALAKVEKEVLTDLRMAFSDGYTGVLRDRDVEVGLAGRPLRLSIKELESLDDAVDMITAPWEKRDYEKETAKKLVRNFMNHISR